MRRVNPDKGRPRERDKKWCKARGAPLLAALVLSSFLPASDPGLMVQSAPHSRLWHSAARLEKHFYTHDLPRKRAGLSLSASKFWYLLEGGLGYVGVGSWQGKGEWESLPWSLWSRRNQHETSRRKCQKASNCQLHYKENTSGGEKRYPSATLCLCNTCLSQATSPHACKCQLCHDQVIEPPNLPV